MLDQIEEPLSHTPIRSVIDNEDLIHGKLLELSVANEESCWIEVKKKDIAIGDEGTSLYTFKDMSEVVKANTALKEKELTIAMSSHQLKQPL